MKYFILGSTGSIGSELTPTLLKRGHDVTGLVRSEHSLIKANRLGLKTVQGDIYKPDQWFDEAADADVLIQLGALSPSGRSSAKWVKAGAALNDQACKTLLEAALKGGKCKAFITASGIYSMGSHGNVWINERTKQIRHPLAAFWRPNERYVIQAREQGINAVSLRFGQIYGANPEGTFGKFFLSMAKKGKLRYMGSGDNYYPFVHIEDAVEAIIKASEKTVKAPFLHIVDDHPIRMKESMSALLGAFNQEAKSVPLWLARLAAGKPMTAGFSGSYRSENALAKALLDWTPQYPSFTDEINTVVTEFQTG